MAHSVVSVSYITLVTVALDPEITGARLYKLLPARHVWARRCDHGESEEWWYDTLIFYHFSRNSANSSMLKYMCEDAPEQIDELRIYRVGQLKWSQLTYSVILPIKMHKRVIIQQCYFIKKQVVIRKNIINAKANKYQQNQTILP